MDGLKISELSARTGCTVETIRFYERKGLLHPPARSEGNYRSYRNGDVERLTFIRHCRSLDMTLEDIQTLLQYRDNPDQDCGDVNTLLDSHLCRVAARLREIKVLEKELKRLRGRCSSVQTARDCGILSALMGDTPNDDVRPAE